MAIEKKLIHFGKLVDFETQLNAGNILNRSIVFIQDAKKIWTHGTYYDCSVVDLSGYVTNDALVSDLQEYVSKDELAEKGYITGITLTGDDYISVNGYTLTLAIDAQGGLTNTGQGLGVGNLRYKLTFGDKSFDGSADKTITASDLGALTSITKAMVTTALGYTPYNSTNPNGYISGIDKSMVASAVGASGNAGKVLSSTGGDLGWISLPTSLPASDVYAWAKASTKPSYTTTEVSEGANLYFTNARAVSALSGTLANYLPLSGGTINGTTTDPIIVNTSETSVGVRLQINKVNKAYVGYGSSVGAYLYNYDTGAYIGVDTSGSPFYHNGTIKTSLIHSGNIGSYAPIYDSSKAVTLAGHLHLGGYIYKGGYTVVDFSGNSLLFGYGTAGAGLPTWVCGKEINFTYGTSWATAMYINSSGNVGIGTTNPAYKLDVNGTARISDEVTMSSTLSVGSHILATTGGTVNIGAHSTTFGNLYLNGGAFFGQSAEGIYIDSTGINWKNASGGWVARLFALTSNSITLRTSTTINGNLVVTGDVASA